MRVASLLALVLSLEPDYLAMAQPAPGNAATPARDGQVMTELGYLVTAADVIAPSQRNVRAELNTARGGHDSGKALGCYFCQPILVFKSTYADEPPDTIVAWTYDLQRFLQQEEGGPADMLRPVHDLDKLPTYRTVRDKFALAWWQAHSSSFANLLPPSQKAFVYDAIVDGVNIWTRYELLSNMGGAEGAIYGDYVRHIYRNASAVDIFF